LQDVGSQHDTAVQHSSVLLVFLHNSEIRRKKLTHFLNWRNRVCQNWQVTCIFGTCIMSFWN